MCKLFVHLEFPDMHIETDACSLKVLIDESTQATEPECLIPLVLGVKQVITDLNLVSGVYFRVPVVFILIFNSVSGCSCW